ncbi:hypothetical protein ACIGHN_10860 [Acidovorax sp. NPDC077693]|uniref:hypothetical protein n=1 Tax=unclassified Acidovorax TaxID=2684926 RepID=UPI0037CBA537
MFQEHGKLSLPSTKPSQVNKALALFKDLPHQMVPHCQCNLAVHAGNQATALNAAFEALLSASWCIPKHSNRIITRAAKLLNLTAPLGLMSGHGA